MNVFIIVVVNINVNSVNFLFTIMLNAGAGMFRKYGSLNF